MNRSNTVGMPSIRTPPSVWGFPPALPASARILSRPALRGASFTSARQLREAIDKFVAAYNTNAAPFEWTKAVVHPSGPKRFYSDLRK
jgi:hypothetical protein